MRLALALSSRVLLSSGILILALGAAACQPSHPAPAHGAPPEAPVEALAPPVTPPTPAAAASASLDQPETPSPALASIAAPVEAADKAASVTAAPPAKAPTPTPTPTVQPATPAPVVVQRAAVQPGVLPQGAGRNVAQRLCGSCHSLVLVTAVGHTEAEWDSVVARMEANGMQASADDINTVIDYLAKALPPR